MVQVGALQTFQAGACSQIGADGPTNVALLHPRSTALLAQLVELLEVLRYRLELAFDQLAGRGHQALRCFGADGLEFHKGLLLGSLLLQVGRANAGHIGDDVPRNAVLQ